MRQHWQWWSLASRGASLFISVKAQKDTFLLQELMEVSVCVSKEKADWKIIELMQLQALWFKQLGFSFALRLLVNLHFHLSCCRLLVDCLSFGCLDGRRHWACMSQLSIMSAFLGGRVSLAMYKDKTVYCMCEAIGRKIFYGLTIHSHVCLVKNHCSLQLSCYFLVQKL